jgi:hypothetical protein
MHSSYRHMEKHKLIQYVGHRCHLGNWYRPASKTLNQISINCALKNKTDLVLCVFLTSTTQKELIQYNFGIIMEKHKLIQYAGDRCHVGNWYRPVSKALNQISINDYCALKKNWFGIVCFFTITAEKELIPYIFGIIMEKHKLIQYVGDWFHLSNECLPVSKALNRISINDYCINYA